MIDSYFYLVEGRKIQDLKRYTVQNLLSSIIRSDLKRRNCNANPVTKIFDFQFIMHAECSGMGD